VGHLNYFLNYPSTTQLLQHSYTALASNPIDQRVAVAKEQTLFIFDINNTQPLYTLHTHYGTILSLDFFDKNYIIIGTSQGRVILYNYTNTQPLCRLSSFPLNAKPPKKYNYISVITTTHNTLACSGYGGGVVVVNPITKQHTTLLQNHTTKITALHFLNPTTLLIGDAKGDLFCYSWHRHIKKLFTIHTSLRTIDTIATCNTLPLAIVGSKQENYAVLIDTKQHKVVQNRYLYFHQKIEEITFLEHKLSVLLTNKQCYNFTPLDSQQLQQAIKNKQLAYAFMLSEQNPLFKYLQEYQQLQKLYTQQCQYALLELINNNKQPLIALQKEFHNLPKQTKELQKLYATRNHYTHLQTLVTEQKYHLALNLAYTHKELQLTPLYTQLEKHFTQQFQQAQQYLTRNQKEQAQKILAPYIQVQEKKEICTLLLRNHTRFLHFLQAIENKDYTQLFTLLKDEPRFKKLPSFTQLLKALEEEIQSLYTLLAHMQIEKLKQKITHLQHIPHLKTQLQDIYFAATKLQELQHCYNNTQYKLCYEIIDTTPLLASTQLAKTLEEEFKHKIHICEHYALQGEVAPIKQELQSLLLITTRKEKIGCILRVGFLVKIKKLLLARSLHSAENMIYSYIDLFGYDSELQKIVEKFEKYSYKKLAISLTKRDQHARDSWRASPLIVDYAK
jgi:hypothetical protein